LKHTDKLRHSLQKTPQGLQVPPSLKNPESHPVGHIFVVESTEIAGS